MYIAEGYMYCKNCGKEIEDNSFFCPYCGSSVNKKIVFERKATKVDKVNSESVFGAIGFAVSIFAVWYSRYISANLIAAFFIAFIGVVLSCAGMREIKKGENELAFAGYIIGAFALLLCGYRWFGLEDYFKEHIYLYIFIFA